MKKLLLTISVTLFIFFGCGSQSEDTAIDDDEMITEATLDCTRCERIIKEVIDSNSDGYIDTTVAYSYNDLGQLSQKTYEEGYHAQTESYLRYTYNDNGYLTAEIHEDADGNLIRHLKIYYDNSCTDTHIDKIFGVSYGTTSEYVYCDVDGHILLREFDYNEDDLIDEEVEYETDSFGRIETETYYDSEGNETESRNKSYVLEYNENGMFVSRTAYNEDGDIFFKSRYGYNDDGQLQTWTFDRFNQGEYDSSSIVYYVYD